MSADILRRAATALRELAAECAPGDWSAETNEKNHAWINVPSDDHAWGMHGWPAEARYVQMMHPPVALAIADWLDFAADLRSGPGIVRFAGPVDHPVVIALAILREPADA